MLPELILGATPIVLGSAGVVLEVARRLSNRVAQLEQRLDALYRERDECKAALAALEARLAP